MLRSGTHAFLKSLHPMVSVSGSTRENTAGIVWGHLIDCSQLPAFWNAVPFHPRATGKPNRAPTTSEVASSQVFLKQILRVLAPHAIIAVGRTAQIALRKLGVENFESVRHPLHGGKRDYIAGLTSAGIRRQ
jgi:uracil-DNA glycosylase